MATPNLGYQNFYSTTLAQTITASDTTIYLNALPTPSEGYLVIEPDSTTGREIIYYTSKGANFVTCPSVASGRGVGGTSAAAHSSGVAVQMNNNAELWTAIQDGSANTGMHQWFNDSFQDYILSGGVITQATGLIASVSSGVAYINGRRLTFNAFSKTNTASKDVYYDIVAPSTVDNIATISYTELASGATGSAPVSNGIHIGLVNTGTNSLATISQSGYDTLGNPKKPTIAITPILSDNATVAASQTTTSTIFTDLATVGPSVTITVGQSGTVLISISGLSSNTNTGIDNLMAFVASGANTISASTNEGVGTWHTYLATAGQSQELSYTRIVTGLTPGVTTFKLQYRTTGGTAAFARRHISVMAL